jgi:hypothetical protein
MLSSFTVCPTIADRSAAIVPLSTHSANHSPVVAVQQQVQELLGQGLALELASVEPASAREVAAVPLVVTQQVACPQA